MKSIKDQLLQSSSQGYNKHMLHLLRIIYFPIAILLVSVITIPICLIRPVNYKNTGFYLKVLRLFSYPMGFNIEVFNKEILNKIKPAVVVGNHQHNYDMIMASGSFTHKIVALGKRQIAYIPLFGAVFWLAGNILISRGNRKSSLKSMAKVEKYLSEKNLGVVIFPEGHRNLSSELLDFKKGAFYTAINCQIPLVIFGVSHYARNMNLNKWKSANIMVEIAGPISTLGLTEKDIPQLMIKTKELVKETIAKANIKAGY